MAAHGPGSDTFADTGILTLVFQANSLRCLLIAACDGLCVPANEMWERVTF